MTICIDYPETEIRMDLAFMIIEFSKLAEHRRGEFVVCKGELYRVSVTRSILVEEFYNIEKVGLPPEMEYMATV